MRPVNTDHPYLTTHYAWPVVGCLLLVAAVLALGNMHRLYALFWEVDNAVVKLSRCERANCEVHGRLRVDGWSGEFVLETRDGEQIRFGGTDFIEIQYPTRAAQP